MISDPEDIQAGIFVLALVKGGESKQITSYRYVAVCNGGIDDNGEVEVMFLRSSGNNKTFKTVEEDVAYLHFTDILRVLPPPNLSMAGDRIFYKFDDLVDVNEKCYS